MAFISTKHVKECGAKLISDLRRALRFFTFVTYLSFIGFYSYSLVTNFDNSFLLIINSCFLAVALLMLLFFMCPIFKTKKNKKRANRTMKYIKYFLSLISVVYNFILYYEYNLSPTHLILTCFSLIMLLINICFSLIVLYFDHYLEQLSEAVRNDYEDSNFIAKKIIDKTPISKIFRDKDEE